VVALQVSNGDIEHGGMPHDINNNISPNHVHTLLTEIVDLSRNKPPIKTPIHGD
jgi:hypothetical protein